MKEKKTESEKTIVIDIKLTRGLVVALSCLLAIVTLLAYLMLTGERAVAAETETAQAASTGMRQFYLAMSCSGAQALTACAEGYHFASLWELADPSNLKYNTSLGVTLDDSGQGPPVGMGWVRTGFFSDTSTTPGRANCAVWASSESDDYGTWAQLPTNWTSGWQQMGVWMVGVTTCQSLNVWCIED